MPQSNISGGAPAPQHARGLLKILFEYDEAKAESLLSTSQGSNARLRSPFTGRLLKMGYDPVEVADVVNSIWPSRWQPRSGPGKRVEDRLPLVCYLLPLCDPDHGTVFNVMEAHRRLEADTDYRSECGYVNRVPGYRVLNSTAAAMVKDWPLFQACLLSSDDLEKVLSRIGRHVVGLPGESSSDLESSIFAPALRELGWNGNLPPLYRREGQISKESRVIRVVGRPRGRACKSNRNSVDGEAGVSSASEGSVPGTSGKCYPRDWRAYNGAQTCEVFDVKALLGAYSDLINLMEIRALGPRGQGRPRFQLGHALFAAVLKIYSGLSSRRFEPHLIEAAEQGYLRSVPSSILSCGAGVDHPLSADPVCIPQFNTVSEFLRSEWLTPLLLELVTVTALPLRDVETNFSVDGTGLSTRIYQRWFDYKPAPGAGDEDGADADNGNEEGTKNGGESVTERKGWVKLHAVGGVQTNVIVRAAISPGNAHDNPFFRGLMSETCRCFRVRSVSADMAYSSGANHDLAEDLGFTPLIPFKSNTRPPSDDGSAWSRSLAYFLEFPEEFWPAYHRRSNSESGFSSLKRVFPEQLRTKDFYAQVNESLCKVVSHNLRTVARELRMRGIDLDLTSDAMTLEDCIREVVEMRKPQPRERAA